MTAPSATSAFRREARVLARTFVVTWLALAVLFVVVVNVTSPPVGRAAGDVLLGLVVGFVIGAINAFWPAVIVAFGRLVYRLVGLAAFVPLPLILLGAAAAFYLLRGWLGGLGLGYLTSLGSVGACGAHGGGPLVLLCLLLGTLTSAAACWALLKLLAALALTLLVGVLPGVTLWIVLVVRAIVRRVRQKRDGAAT